MVWCVLSRHVPPSRAPAPPPRRLCTCSPAHPDSAATVPRAALPYIKSPAQQPPFSKYFRRPWIDTFTLSLHNFLASIFQHLRASAAGSRARVCMTVGRLHSQPLHSCTVSHSSAPGAA